MANLDFGESVERKRIVNEAWNDIVDQCNGDSRPPKYAELSFKTVALRLLVIEDVIKDGGFWQSRAGKATVAAGGGLGIGTVALAIVEAVRLLAGSG